MRFLLHVVTSVLLSEVFALAQSNPVPFINLPIAPTAAAPGGSGFVLTVNGAGFINGSVVTWNGTALSTIFISAAQLTAQVTPSELAQAGNASVTVSNPPPGGGSSNVAYFEITQPQGAIAMAGLPTASGTLVNVMVADLNNDGKLDLVLTFLDPVTGNTPESIALGNGDGTFQTPIALGVDNGDDHGTVLAADFNHDGKMDLLLISNNFPSTITVLLGNGDGTFQSTINSGAQANTAYFGPVIGDFNEDGNLDVITTYTNGPNHGLAVFLGNGDGSFQAPMLLSGSALSGDLLVVGDMNGDGHLDLITQPSGSSLVPNALLVGNGNGTFQAPIPFSWDVPLALGLSVSAADLNGDGKPDLVYGLADPHPYKTYAMVALNSGNVGSLFPAPTQVTFGMPSAPVDLDGDGNLDLVISPTVHPVPADGLSVLTGKGDGSFNSPVLITTETGMPLSVLAEGDFNGDGKLDFMAVDPNGIIWTLLQGNFAVAVAMPSTLDFGSQTIGTTSSAQNVVIRNTGTATVSLSNANVTGIDTSDFIISNSCSATLTGAASCQIAVTFKPVVGGTRTASLNIRNTGMGSQIVSLTGVGDTTVPILNLSPTTLGFGAQGIGATTSQSINLSNPGPGTVTIPTLSLQGQNAADFSINGQCNSQIVAGGSCAVAVSFSPGAIGPRSASLSVSDNAAGSPQAVPLSGSGPDFGIGAGGTSLTIAAGQTATYTLSLQPFGGFSQPVALSCSGAPLNSRCTLPTSVVSDGSSAPSFLVTVSTAGFSGKGNSSRPISNGLACAVFGFPLLVTFGEVTQSRAKGHRALGIVTFSALILVMSGCGGASSQRQSGTGSGTPSGTYAITVSGSSRSGGTTLTHAVSLTLIVQ